MTRILTVVLGVTASVLGLVEGGFVTALGAWDDSRVVMAVLRFPGDFLLLPCPVLVLAGGMVVASFRRKGTCS